MTKQVRRRAIVFGLSALLACVAGVRAMAQDPPPPQPPPGGRAARGGQRQPGLPMGEVDRLFDSYVAMQAQEALKLTDAQFPKFLSRLKVLQQTRRQHLAARRAVVAELNSNLKAPAESPLAESLRKLRDIDARYTDDLRKAYEGVDQVLDVTQQARFRVFEESVERRKFDLMLRARGRAQQQGGADRRPLP